jgi:hypothetical protein
MRTLRDRSGDGRRRHPDRRRTGDRAGSAAGKADRDHAVCKSRACLLVLESRHDKDGDGVADVDEAVLYTDPGDALSVPDAGKLLDLMLARELPSFEKHLSTSWSCCPRSPRTAARSPPGWASSDLRDGDANLLKSIGIVIDQTRRNGFDALFGFTPR